MRRPWWRDGAFANIAASGAVVGRKKGAELEEDKGLRRCLVSDHTMVKLKVGNDN